MQYVKGNLKKLLALIILVLVLCVSCGKKEDYPVKDNFSPTNTIVSEATPPANTTEPAVEPTEEVKEPDEEVVSFSVDCEDVVININPDKIVENNNGTKTVVVNEVEIEVDVREDGVVIVKDETIRNLVLEQNKIQEENTAEPTLEETTVPTPIPTKEVTEETVTPTKGASNTPTNTPTKAPTNTTKPTVAPTNEAGKLTPSTTPIKVTPTNTPKPTAVPTKRPTPTINIVIGKDENGNINAVTPTPTRVPTNTPTPTMKPTNTPTLKPTATNTPRPTATNTPVPTRVITNTPTPTRVPTSTPTPTRKPTNTPTPKPTATPIPSKTVKEYIILVPRGVTGKETTMSHYGTIYYYYCHNKDGSPNYEYVAERTKGLWNQYDNYGQGAPAMTKEELMATYTKENFKEWWGYEITDEILVDELFHYALSCVDETYGTNGLPLYVGCDEIRVKKEWVECDSIGQYYYSLDGCAYRKADDIIGEVYTDGTIKYTSSKRARDWTYEESYNYNRYYIWP